MIEAAQTSNLKGKAASEEAACLRNHRSSVKVVAGARKPRESLIVPINLQVQIGGTKPPLPNFGKTVTRDPETDVLCTLILSGFKTSCRTHQYQFGVSRSSPSDECLKRDHPSPLLKQLAEKLFQIANKLDETAIIVFALELSQFLLSVGDRSPRQHIIMSIQSFLYFMTKRRPCFLR